MISKQRGQYFSNTKHIFSFYCPLSIQASWLAGSIVWLQDQDLIHRLIKVIKIQKDDQFVLFDKKQHVSVQVLAALKKEIQVRIISVQNNPDLKPKITYLLPLLKKEALEQAVYSLAEIGVSEIRLVVTAKSRQSLMSPVASSSGLTRGSSSEKTSSKEFQRLYSIVIAAAEQSKNYDFPELFESQALSDVVSDLSSSASKIVFDASGQSFFDVRTDLKPSPLISCGLIQASPLAMPDTAIGSSILLKSSQEVILLVGPEGGITQDELSWLVEKQSFQTCALTQTTLRAVQAVAVSAALFRLS